MLRGALVSDTTPGASDLPTSGAPDLTMPDVRGLTEVDALQVLVDAGADPNAVVVKSVPYLGTTGTIVAQDPVVGTTRPKAITLSLQVPATMPVLAGKSLDEASAALAAIGARPAITRVYSPTVKAGSVISTDPAGGAALTADPALVVSGDASTMPLSSVRSLGGCDQISSGSVDGVKIGNGIECRVSDTRTTGVWILLKAAGRLQGTLGLEDGSPPDAKAHVTLTADGRTIVDQDVAYGTSLPVDADMTGVLRVQLDVSQVTAPTSSSTPRLVFANAAVLGSTEAIASIGAAQ